MHTNEGQCDSVAETFRACSYSIDGDYMFGVTVPPPSPLPGTSPLQSSESPPGVPRVHALAADSRVNMRSACREYESRSTHRTQSRSIQMQ